MNKRGQISEGEARLRTRSWAIGGARELRLAISLVLVNSSCAPEVFPQPWHGRKLDPRTHLVRS